MTQMAKKAIGKVSELTRLGFLSQRSLNSRPSTFFEIPRYIPFDIEE